MVAWLYGWIARRMDGWGRTDGGTEGRRDGGTEGRMDGGTDGRMEGWRDGGMQGWISRLVGRLVAWLLGCFVG